MKGGALATLLAAAISGLIAYRTSRRSIAHAAEMARLDREAEATALHGRLDRNDHHGHLEYDGVVIETGPRPRQVKFTVVVQYTRKTTDGRYDAGRGQKIGVITAYCHNQPGNKCPAWAKM